MNTRRIPFQFSTTDPLARQRELERRFGLQPTCPKMYVDMNNPLSMGTTPKEISSPRLQHRVPIFAEGYDQPIHSSSVDSMASIPENKKPNVRVIPIEVEGAERSPRHRTYSGPAGTIKDCCDSLSSERNGIPPFKRFNFEDLTKPSKSKLNEGPKIFNIPIQVEGANMPRSPKSSVNRVDATPKPESTVPTTNGCSQSKADSKVKSTNKSEVLSESNEKQADQPENTVDILLKKIDDVLNEFKTYETGVVEFTGTSKDKQYRYLDEMLTRCMLRLDDIDTMGNEKIRLARKSAVKKIQASIDLLESKANVEPITSTEVSETQLVPSEKNVDNEVDMQDKKVSNSVISAESTESSEMNLISSSSKDQSKVSDNNLNNETETNSKINSLKTEEKLNNATDVEMHEMPRDEESAVSISKTTNVDGSFENKDFNLSQVSNETEDVMQCEESLFLQQQQNNIAEIEMSEELPLDKTGSTKDSQSSDLLESTNICAKQNDVSNETVANDVEMLDENNLMLHSVKCKESLNEFADNESHLPKLSKISEVEMDEIGDVSSEKKDSGSKTVNCKSDSFDEKSGNVKVESIITSEDAEINSGVHETINDCLTDLSGQDDTSETCQSEKTLKN